MSSPEESTEPPLELPIQRRARPVLRRSERELKAFLSTVMRGALNDARQVVVDVLDSAPFLAPWAFEFTPASSEPADDTYLRHVRDADIVIWLAGPEITQPVINEVREALARRRRLIIIRYGAEARSAECNALLDEVGLRAKYADAVDLNELRSVLQLTLEDEIIRALRGMPDMGRLTLIQQLGQASRGRCVARWQAPGLPRGEAVALADDPAIGALPADCLPNEEAPVVVLSSQMGAGKSLGADRHLQAGIDRMLTDGAAPVPVWLTATQARAELLVAVTAGCDGIGDPRVHGATVVVDGLDESGVEVAEQLLGEARGLALTWPHTTVLLTSRPVPSLDRVEECRRVPELDEVSSKAIIDIGASDNVSRAAMLGLPDTVRHSLRRPLFALLYGLRRREDPAGAAPQSRGDLLAFLGGRVAARAGAAGQQVLRNLAVKSIARELGPVPVQEIGTPAEVEALLTGGLVANRPGGIAPGLPVIAQWYAAQALLLGDVDVEQLLAAPEDIDLWLYPLAIAVASGSQEQGAAILEPIMRALPGFAFIVVDEALGTVGFDDNNAPPWRAAGEQMRAAMQATADGLGDLGRLALPLDRHGIVVPLAVSTEGSRVDYAIWEGEEPRDPVHAMSRAISPFEPIPGYTLVGFSEIGRGSSWAWRWVRERLRYRLKQVFERKLLPARRDGVIAEERTWLIACALANSSGLFAEPIELAPLLENLDTIIAHAGRELGAAAHATIRLGATDVDAVRARELLAAMHDRDPVLHAPHPGADQRPDGPGGSMVGMLYSDARLIEHVTSVYEKAIRAYDELVEGAFVAVGDRLVHHATFPARYVGAIDPKRAPDAGGAFGLPVLSGYFEPLPRDEPSRVELELSDQRAGRGFSRGLADELRRLRPEAARWITAWSGTGILRLSGRTPSTNLAYQWLWQDLVQSRIATGTRPGSGGEY
jgi:hypothetical protein